MSVSMRTLIEQRFRSSSPDVPALARQLTQLGKHHAPGQTDVLAAIESGEVALVEAVLGASALPEAQRAALATAGLQAWAANPLASRQALGLVQSLLAKGAKASVPGSAGMSALDQVQPLLDDVWKKEGERKGLAQGKPLPPAASSVLLAQCVGALRLSLGLDDPLGLDDWRARRLTGGAPAPNIRPTGVAGP